MGVVASSPFCDAPLVPIPLTFWGAGEFHQKLPFCRNSYRKLRVVFSFFLFADSDKKYVDFLHLFLSFFYSILYRASYTFPPFFAFRQFEFRTAAQKSFLPRERGGCWLWLWLRPLRCGGSDKVMEIRSRSLPGERKKV